MNFDINSNFSNNFISVEGVDGAGKGVQIEKIVGYLKGLGYDVLQTREPGGTIISEKIREVIFMDNVDPLTEAYLFASARRQLVQEKILPALKKGKIVITDRFVDSSIVYQGKGRGLGMEFIEQLNAPAVSGCMPFKTIYLDLEPEIGLKRIRVNGRESNRLDNEAIDFYKKNREGFLYLAKKYPDRYIVINANKSIEEVFNDIKESVLNPLFKKN